MSIRSKIRKETHGMTQNKIVQPGTGRHQDEERTGKKFIRQYCGKIDWRLHSSIHTKLK